MTVFTSPIFNWYVAIHVAGESSFGNYCSEEKWVMEGTNPAARRGGELYGNCVC